MSIYFERVKFRDLEFGSFFMFEKYMYVKRGDRHGVSIDAVNKTPKIIPLDEEVRVVYREENVSLRKVACG